MSLWLVYGQTSTEGDDRIAGIMTFTCHLLAHLTQNINQTMKNPSKGRDFVHLSTYSILICSKKSTDTSKLKSCHNFSCGLSLNTTLSSTEVTTTRSLPQQVWNKPSCSFIQSFVVLAIQPIDSAGASPPPQRKHSLSLVAPRKSGHWRSVYVVSALSLCHSCLHLRVAASKLSSFYPLKWYIYPYSLKLTPDWKNEQHIYENAPSWIHKQLFICVGIIYICDCIYNIYNRLSLWSFHESFEVLKLHLLSTYHDCKVWEAQISE